MRHSSTRLQFNRRAILLSVGAAPVLALSGFSAEAETKISQSAVHYQRMGKDGQDCDDCSHFMAPHGCKLVEGAISPKGWCQLWVKRSS